MLEQLTKKDKKGLYFVENSLLDYNKYYVLTGVDLFSCLKKFYMVTSEVLSAISGYSCLKFVYVTILNNTPLVRKTLVALKQLLL